MVEVCGARAHHNAAVPSHVNTYIVHLLDSCLYADRVYRVAE